MNPLEYMTKPIVSHRALASSPLVCTQTLLLFTSKKASEHKINSANIPMRPLLSFGVFVSIDADSPNLVDLEGYRYDYVQPSHRENDSDRIPVWIRPSIAELKPIRVKIMMNYRI
jgi:hypothetical protein